MANPSDRNRGNYQVESVELDPTTPEEIAHKALDVEQDSASGGAIFAYFLIVIGAGMCILGVTGTVDLDISLGGMSAKATQASAGIAIALIGLLVYFMTRPKIRITKGQDSGTKK